jgi:Sugar-tranasporters, 12 TM
MAILAGIVAQILEDYLGHIGPFQGAIALTSLALILVLGWEENYGEEEKGDHDNSSLYKQFIDGWTSTFTDSRIWRIGMTQALSEGAMYTVSTHLQCNPVLSSFSFVNHSLSDCYPFPQSLYSCGSQLCCHKILSVESLLGVSFQP